MTFPSPLSSNGEASARARVMKFGDTLYQRSVPEWAAYNVNYNEIKRLIKERTSTGLAVPVSVPTGSSQTRWQALEDDLVVIIREQYDNVGLFLKSKYGEIDRRLNYLEKQVRSVQKAARQPYTNTSIPNRKCHKLVEDADAIGQDIQNLTRFAAVQKTAIRKVLKKYRKWTGSTSLQSRLENEVFASGQLGLDYVHPLDRLATQMRIVEAVQGKPQRRDSLDPASQRRNSTVTSSPVVATVLQIKNAEEKGPVNLDAALAAIPFGRSSGSATYWIHPDNLDEARALMLRHVREIFTADHGSRRSSASLASGSSREATTESAVDGNMMVYFDNPQRYLQDSSANRPSKIALSARWCQKPWGIVTLSNLAPWNPSGTIVNVKRKDMAKALKREVDDLQAGRQLSENQESIRRVQEYLSEHRDVKAQARVQSVRSRYAGHTNSAKVGIWAVLDRNIVVYTFGSADVTLSDGALDGSEAFPHAVLEVRWEFSRTPELVRAFDSSHLAERVQNFSLESVAVNASNKQLPTPAWKALLEKDIRKVPIVTRAASQRDSLPRVRIPGTGSTSDPSSTDGATESVFSAQEGPSSITSLESPNTSARDPASPSTTKSSATGAERKKKKARIQAESPPRASRYWNEFDDGDEDVNPQEAYTIYVDPEEKFPGAETVTKAFDTVYHTLGNATSRLTTMLSKHDRPKPRSERSALLGSHNRTSSDLIDSSDSDVSPADLESSAFGTFPRGKSRPGLGSRALYRPNQLLTPRQRTLERTYFWSYVGLICLSYVILFICGTLLFAGRQDEVVEIDVAMVTGIAAAVACSVVAIALLWMRRTPLKLSHRSVIYVAVFGALVVGIAELVGVVHGFSGI